MSHNLEMINGEASMAYAGAMPWHSLGTQVKERMSTTEAIKLGKCDFEVQSLPILARFQDGFITEGLNDFQAIVRKDTQRALGVVGKRYNIVQYSDCFKFFDNIIEKGQAIIETVGVLGHGEKFWAMAKLPESIEVRDRDVVDLYLLLTASHDGTSSIRAKFTPTRVVCQNTLSAALIGGSDVSIRHTQSAEARISEASKLMGIVSQSVEASKVTFEKLAKKALTLSMMDTYLNELFFTDKEVSTQAKNNMDTIKKLVVSGKGNDGSSLWDLYNGVTEYIDHDRTTKNNGSNWIASNFGSGAIVRNKAFNLALALV